MPLARWAGGGCPQTVKKTPLRFVRDFNRMLY